MKRITLKLLATALVFGGTLSLGAQETDSADGIVTNDVTVAPGLAQIATNNSRTTVESQSPRLRHGPVVVFGGTARVNAGEAAEAVVAIGGDAKAEGNVRKAVVAIGGDAEAQSEVGDAVVAVGGNAFAKSKVRAVVAILGNAEAQGAVQHSVVAIMGDIKIGSNSVVRGDVVSVGGTVQVASGAEVHGKITEVGVGNSILIGPVKGLVDWFKHGALKLRLIAPSSGWCWLVVGLFFLFYFLLGAAFPRPVAACVNELEKRPATTFMLGLLMKVIVPLITIVLVATGVGIVVLPFIGAALFIGAAFGKAALFQYLGRLIVRVFGVELTTPLLALFTGFVFITLLYLVPILSLLIYMIVGLWGIGIAVTAAFVRARKETPPATSPTTPPPMSGPTATMNPAGTSAFATNVPPLTMPQSEVPPADSYAQSGFAPTPMAVPPTNFPPGGVSALTLPRAGFWERMGAAFLDVIIVGILMGFIAQSPIRHQFGPPLGLLVALAYFAGMWTWKGTTVGGIVLNLKVVRLDDKPLSFMVALVRGLAAAFSVLVFFLGFLWIVFDRDKQAWHDKIAGTVVVRTPRGMSLVCL